MVLLPFTAIPLLVGPQKRHPPAKKLLWPLKYHFQKNLHYPAVSMILVDVLYLFPQRIFTGSLLLQNAIGRYLPWSTTGAATVLPVYLMWCRLDARWLLTLRPSQPSWIVPLWVRSATCRHQPPQRTVLGQVNCFVQCEVVGSQVSLDGVQPRDAGTPWWSLSIIWWGSC